VRRLPSGHSADEKVAFERLQFLYSKGIGYAIPDGLRPQTLCALADSAVGLAAYQLDLEPRGYAADLTRLCRRS